MMRTRSKELGSDHKVKMKDWYKTGSCYNMKNFLCIKSEYLLRGLWTWGNKEEGLWNQKEKGGRREISFRFMAGDVPRAAPSRRRERLHHSIACRQRQMKKGNLDWKGGVEKTGGGG